MMKTFSIKGNYFKEKTFPGLNEYIAALGTNPRKGGRMKAEYEMIACNAIRRELKRWKTEKPVILHYKFYEPQSGQKRDYMNIFSFADNVIEDALQKWGVIKDDDPRYVKNTTHEFFYTDGTPRIEVSIEEID